MKEPIFSIIVCVYKVSDRFYHDLLQFNNLTYGNFELILVTEKNETLDKEKINNLSLPVRIVKAEKPKLSLGQKRDIGYRSAKGEFCAYIDDDAYPDKDWLSNALRILQEDRKIGALGGPNLTPKEDSFWSRIGGYIYEAYMTSAGAQYRYLPKKRGEVREVQGVNMIIPRHILIELGGFHYDLNCADDGKVCSDIKKKGYKIMYDPHVVVYHHRRKFPLDHLKQVKGMGLHRGFFLKAFPDTLGPIFFFPPAFVILSLTLLAFSLFVVKLRLILLVLFFLYFVICYISSLKRTGFLSALIVAVGIMLTHFTYGIFFLKGLTMEKLSDI